MQKNRHLCTNLLHKCLFLVEATGLEPTTSWSLTKRATKLRYASMYYAVSRFSSLNSINNYTQQKALSQAFFMRFLTFLNLAKLFLQVLNIPFYQSYKSLRSNIFLQK